MIKTKIIATLGPASANWEAIEALIKQGIDIFRLNFSHGRLEEHGRMLAIIDEIRSRHHHSIAVMGDLCGPKIRTSLIEPDGDMLKEGEQAVIESGVERGSAARFGTNYAKFYEEVRVGDRVLIDDGQLALKVVDKVEALGREVWCKVLVGGPLRSRKGINLPDTEISAPAITERDWECVAWAMAHKLDYLALSFVRRADELHELNDHLRGHESPIRVVAKIEKPQAVAELESIVQASDAVLVARGDLGVEMDLAEVPLIQKRITQMCRRLGKPVIVATQMLQSMIAAPGPTRAEVSDVANAIMDFTDAVMLSGETAVGRYPLEAVRTIERIASKTEAFLDREDLPRPRIAGDGELEIISSLAYHTAFMVDDLGDRIKMVVTWSQTGATARLLSKSRIDVPIVSFSSDPLICRQMNMHYGVTPICLPLPGSPEAFMRAADELILTHQWAQRGDQVIVLPGPFLSGPDARYAILVHTLSKG